MKQAGWPRGDPAVGDMWGRGAVDDFERKLRDMAARAEVIAFAMDRAHNAPYRYRCFLPPEVIAQTTLKLKQVMPVIEWLVEKGVLMRDNDRNPPLHSAETRRHKITVDALRAIDGPESDFSLEAKWPAFGGSES